MKTFAETENYIAIVVPGGNQGHNTFSDAVKFELQNMEHLTALGYQPLHYLPRFGAWVCRKPPKAEQIAA